MKKKSVKKHEKYEKYVDTPKISIKGSEIKVVGGGLVRMFKIGDDSRPAGPDDIKDFAENLTKCYNEPGRKLICHHLVQTEVIGQEEAHFLMQLHDKGIITGKELKKKIGL